MISSDYRSIARHSLSAKWGISILITFVAGLLGAGGGGSLSFNFMYQATDNLTSNIPTFTYKSYIFGSTAVYSVGLLGIWAGIIGIIGVVTLVFRVVIGGVVDLGLRQYNMRLVMGYPQQPFATLFERFQIFGKAFLLQLVMAFFITLWSLLFLIPGIIASLRYSMAPYLLAADPSLGVMEALDLSKKMMKGNKGRLFSLQLSFIGWIILSAFSCMIGFLWLIPYMNAAEAAFYLDLAGHLQQRQQNVAPYGTNVPPYNGGYGSPAPPPYHNGYGGQHPPYQNGYAQPSQPSYGTPQQPAPYPYQNNNAGQPQQAPSPYHNGYASQPQQAPPPYHNGYVGQPPQAPQSTNQSNPTEQPQQSQPEPTITPPASPEQTQQEQPPNQQASEPPSAQPEPEDSAQQPPASPEH